MRAKSASVIVKCVLVVFGLGLAAIFLQIAMEQARRTSCTHASSDNTKCLAPSVADYGLASDGRERKVDGPSPKTSP